MPNQRILRTLTAECSTVEDQEVERRELFDKIPDGEYILEHYYPKPFHGRARVANGTLEILS